MGLLIQNGDTIGGISSELVEKIGSATLTTTAPDLSGAVNELKADKADKATTLSGYGITDAKITSGTITLGANSITPLTSHQSVTDNNPTLAWGAKSKVATIGSTEINVTMPSNPNTDTKVKQNLLANASGGFLNLLLSDTVNTEKTAEVKMSRGLSYDTRGGVLKLADIADDSSPRILVDNGSKSCNYWYDDVILSGDTWDGTNTSLKSAITDKWMNIKGITGTSKSTADTGNWVAMCKSSSTGSPTLPTADKWWHVLSLDCWKSAPNNWVSQLAIATQESSGVWWRRNSSSTSVDSASWTRLADANANGYANRALADGDGNTISSTYLKLSGGTLTGNTFVKRASGESQLGAANTASGKNVYLYAADSGTVGVYSNIGSVLINIDTNKKITIGGTTYGINNPANFRSALGLGSMATQNSSRLILWKMNSRTNVTQTTTDDYWTVGQFPAKSGYTRYVMQIQLNNRAMVASYYTLESNNDIRVYTRMLSGTSQTFSIDVICVYLPDANKTS